MEISSSIRRRARGVNVPRLERILSTGLGAVGAGLGVALALTGARRMMMIGGAVAALGAGLMARGISGRCAITRAIAGREPAETTNHHQPDFHGAGATTRQGVRDLDHFH